MDVFTPVDYALAAVRRGWCVFPVVAGAKRPLVRGWEKSASRDPDRVRAWWHRWPEANYGIAAGPSGLVVIDLDTPKPDQVRPSEWQRPGITDGADVLAAVAEEAGQRIETDTFTVSTRRGGTHLYYTAPPGAALRNTSGDRGQGLGWLIDTRAAGGYVVGPGSRVADANGAGTYEVISPAPAAPLPGWLTDRLTRAASPLVSVDGVLADIAATGKRRSAYASAAFRGEVDRVLSAPPKTRNTSLYIAAVSLGQLAAKGLLDTAEITAALQRAGEAVGQPPREAAATIRSGLNKGLTVPRRTSKENV